MAKTRANPWFGSTASKNCLCFPVIFVSHSSFHGPRTVPLSASASAAVKGNANAAAPTVIRSRNSRRSVCIKPPRMLWQANDIMTSGKTNAKMSEFATELDLEGHELTAVPESIRHHMGLERLGLRANRIASVPEWIGDLVSLRHLSLALNGLETVPESLWRLTGLESLKLSDKRLSRISDSLGRLAHLRMLDVGDNQLAELPNSIRLLGGLTDYLYLSHNRLATVPTSLGDLRGLRYLNIGGNQFSALPTPVTRMTGLRELLLRGNALADLPA